MMEVTSKEHYSASQRLRSSMAIYREAADLINIGAYVSGSNPDIDRAIVENEPIKKFLQQGVFEVNTYKEAVDRLIGMFANT
jgi:flagellum-specific ATP synthase